MERVCVEYVTGIRYSREAARISIGFPLARLKAETKQMKFGNTFLFEGNFQFFFMYGVT